jgi:Kelch motif
LSPESAGGRNHDDRVRSAPRRAARAAAGCIAALASVTRAECPSGSWLSLALLSEPRQELTAAALDGKVYDVGGLAGRPNANEIYDPATNRWSPAYLPVGTDHAWALALGSRLWALSQLSYSPAIEGRAE